MSRTRELEALRAELQYRRDSVALLRARLYRWGAASSARLKRLEREVASAEERLREARLRPPS